jgi:long-subunit acyl-CoA synthetase (AMP-forming)
MHWQEAEREFADDVVARETLPRTFERSAERNADGVAQRYKGGVYDRSLVTEGVLPAAPDGEYADLTYAEMRDVVRRLAAGFREVGVDGETRVAFYAETRMEWAQADFAALAAGAVVTSVYASSSPDQVRYLLEDPGATVVVVEDRDLLEEVDGYEGTHTRAAALLRKIITAHYFEDANKRTGWATTRKYLENHREAPADRERVERVLRNIRSFSVEEIAEWLKTGEIDEKRFHPR